MNTYRGGSGNLGACFRGRPRLPLPGPGPVTSAPVSGSPGWPGEVEVTSAGDTEAGARDNELEAAAELELTSVLAPSRPGGLPAGLSLHWPLFVF